MRRVFVLLAAFFFVAGIAGSALADKALFRAQRSFLNLPNPAVTTPGNAGKAIDPLVPGTIYKATYNAPQYYQGPAVADVQPGNPVGSPFTLPTGFESYQGTYTITSQTGWYGYTTISILSNWNGPGRFGPQHTHSGSTTVTTVFPTTGGNVDPNGGGVFQGQPALHCTVGTPNKPASSNLCGTTNYGGRYDFSRWGTIKVTPGPNQFGGTLKTLYGANSSWYQNIKYFSPTMYKAYRGFFCKQPGSDRTGARQPGRTRGDRARRECSSWKTNHPGRLSPSRHSGCQAGDRSARQPGERIGDRDPVCRTRDRSPFRNQG